MTDSVLPENYNLRDELDKVASVVATARRLLTEGRMIDLSALEDKVRMVCEAARDAKPEERDTLCNTMASIIANLDDLAADLAQQFGAIAEGGLESTPSQAAAAYRKPGNET